MNVADFLKSFVLDTWYKVLLYLGATVLVVSLFVDVKGLTNSQLQLLSSGVFLVGLGEWKNHKVAAWIKPPNLYTGGPALMQTTVRQADFVGVVLVVAGLILFVLGIASIFGW